RARRERPRGCRAAEQSDELAAFHSDYLVGGGEERRCHWEVDHSGPLRSVAPILPFKRPLPAFPLCDLSHAMISGQTCAPASRPTSMPRCCKQPPTSPGDSMIRAFFAAMASTKGLTEVRPATSSAILTTASVGAESREGPTSVSPSSNV